MLLFAAFDATSAGFGLVDGHRLLFFFIGVFFLVIATVHVVFFFLFGESARLLVVLEGLRLLLGGLGGVSFLDFLDLRLLLKF